MSDEWYVSSTVVGVRFVFRLLGLSFASVMDLLGDYTSQQRTTIPVGKVFAVELIKGGASGYALLTLSV